MAPLTGGSAMSQRSTPMAHLGAQEPSVGGSGVEADKEAGTASFGSSAHTLGFLQQRRVPVPDGPVYTGAWLRASSGKVTCMCSLGMLEVRGLCVRVISSAGLEPEESVS